MYVGRFGSRSMVDPDLEPKPLVRRWNRTRTRFETNFRTIYKKMEPKPIRFHIWDGSRFKYESSREWIRKSSLMILKRLVLWIFFFRKLRYYVGQNQSGTGPNPFTYWNVNKDLNTVSNGSEPRSNRRIGDPFTYLLILLTQLFPFLSFYGI